MTEQSSHDVTLLLEDWRRGVQAALDKILPLVCDELHRLAHRYMAGEWDHAKAWLVHELKHRKEA